MYDIWVVVAENSRARIFSMKNSRTPLRELEDMVHPEGRSHEQKLSSDRPGRTFDIRGSGRHAKETEVTPKKHETANFAKRIADYINLECGKGKFEKLILIAAPEFLGLLRKNLNETTKQRITRQIDKNIVKHNEAMIRDYLATLPD